MWCSPVLVQRFETGNALPLSSMPLGTTIHNVELKPGKGGQLIRSAGGAAQVMGRDGEYVQVRLRSVNVEKFFQLAWQLSDRLGIRIMRILMLERPVGCDGWADARMCAES